MGEREKERERETEGERRQVHIFINKSSAIIKTIVIIKQLNQYVFCWNS